MNSKLNISILFSGFLISKLPSNVSHFQRSQLLTVPINHLYSNCKVQKSWKTKFKLSRRTGVGPTKSISHLTNTVSKKTSNERKQLTFMTKVVFLMSMGNWSVSHPRSGEPVFESTEPSMPRLFCRKQRCHRKLCVKSQWCIRCGRYSAHKCVVRIKMSHAEAMTISCS